MNGKAICEHGYIINSTPCYSCKIAQLEMQLKGRDAYIHEITDIVLKERKCTQEYINELKDDKSKLQAQLAAQFELSSQAIAKLQNEINQLKEKPS